MLKHHYQIPVTLIGIIDVVLAYLCWELAYSLRFLWINYPEALILPERAAYTRAGLLVAVIAGLTFIIVGSYRDYQPKVPREVLKLIKSCFWLFIFTLSIAFFYRKFSYSRVHIIYFFSLYFFALVIVRVMARSFLKTLYRKGLYVKNILVVGKSHLVDEFVQRFYAHRHIGLVIKGIVNSQEDMESKTIGGKTIPRLGSLESLPGLIQQHQVHQVFLALSPDEYSHIESIRNLLSDQMVDIKIIPDLGKFKRLHTDVEKMDGIPIITVTQSPMSGWNVVIKRIMDIAGSFLALLLFAPVMLCLSMLIKLSSKGPVLYTQERMGFDGETFQTLKFRSMRIDAESGSGAVWASANDDRCTPIGAFMRKTSLDELPQLFNVLTGQMSLVGPRPERPVLIDNFKGQIPDYMLRHKVKAGMTGWAQINGWRGNTSLEKRIECDLFYIANWSVWLDIKILILTVFKGFVHDNAY